MYGLPKDFDASVFIGLTLERATFTKNQVIFDFEKSVSLLIEGSFAHSHEDKAKQEDVKEPPIETSSVMELLECVVQTASGHEDGTLSIVFENGQSLTCYDDRPNYEAYQIKLGDRTILV